MNALKNALIRSFSILFLVVLIKQFYTTEKSVDVFFWILLLKILYVELRRDLVEEVIIDGEKGIVTLKYFRILSGTDKAIFYFDNLSIKSKKPKKAIFNQSQALIFRGKFGPRFELDVNKDGFSKECLDAMEGYLKEECHL